MYCLRHYFVHNEFLFYFDFQEPRLTTNKKKIGVHYYKKVNVKNKNRNKKAKQVEGQTGRKKRKTK